MNGPIPYLWLIPLLPLAGFAINGLYGLITQRVRERKPNRYLVATLACGLVLAAFVLGLAACYELAQLPAEERSVEQLVFHWIQGGDVATTGYGAGAVAPGTVPFQVEWAILLDPLSAVMLLVVTGVGLLIHVFAIGYMWADTGFYRFFSYMNLFMFAMLVLVLGNNYLMMFLGWEGVGFCSYALIGFYFHKKSAGDAGKKAFVVNRVGDYGFIVGVLLLFATFGTFNFGRLAGLVKDLPAEAHFGVLSAITLMFFIGACGKSAQIPLYVWLPDAMEGPTPVSALIHAATMVTAGVYMVTRSNFLFTRAPVSLELVGFVGITTALAAALMALFQRDIKRVLAYSTISQLGYMFAALGVAAFAAGIMHLMTHAFFKALLFLGAGSIIHALHHEQDMQRMGNLRRHMPVTFATMMMAYLAICGIFPFSGFFSKDEILWRSFASGHYVFYGLGLAAAGLTAFYMTRLMVLTFFSTERITPEARHHLHESPAVMTLPLVALAVLSVAGGWIGLPAWLGANTFEHWLAPVFRHAIRPEAPHFSHGFEFAMAMGSVAVAAIGIGLAYLVYQKRGVVPDREMTWGRLWRALYHKFYVDDLYDALIIRPCKGLGNLLAAFDLSIIDGFVNGTAAATRGSATVSGWFDKYVVDGLVNLQAWIVQNVSGVLRRLQTGVAPNYALAIVLGIVILSCLYIFR
ncbi:MAG TPA: NADH-quinone oxidoreductase subunit L [Acidobacteriota bacterium]|nr:NADH-quinone oxidoreductase subunit L [Acidobacteriota bacterium]